MKKENILFAIVGVLLGFITGFVVANQINRSGNLSTASAQATTAPVQPGMPTADSLNHGSVTNNGGMLTDVQEKLDKAKNEPDNFDAQIEAAGMFVKIERYDKALAYYEQANKLKPDDYKTIVSIGNALFEIRNYEEAEKWFTKAIEKKPDDVAVRNDLGLSLFLRKQPDYERAMKEFNIVLSKDPNHEKTLQNLAALYKDKGDKDSFEQTLAKMEKLNPQNPAIKVLKGEIQPEPPKATQ